MKKHSKINILKYAKLQGIIFIFIGLLAGIIYSFGGLIVDTLVTLGWFTTNETPGLSYGTALAFQALIGMPIIFAIFGYITGLIGAFIFNLFARKFKEVNLNVSA